MKELDKTQSSAASKLKIFALYHRQEHIFKTDVIEPLQTGCDNTKEDLNILKDNTGDNISYKNENYAELTAHYWVWKNYLKEHSNLEYVGFCHYRRFLDFTRDISPDIEPFEDIPIEKFQENFDMKYTADAIYPAIKDYDVILPEKNIFENINIYDQYKLHHSTKHMDIFIDVVKKYYPEMTDEIDSFLSGNDGYFCLNFIMKIELFYDYMNFIFNVLPKAEQSIAWNDIQEYSDQKTSAYIIERFFNVWLNYKIKNQKIRVLHRQGLLLLIGSSRKSSFLGVKVEKNTAFTEVKIFGITFRIDKTYIDDVKIYKWRNLKLLKIKIKS